MIKIVNDDFLHTKAQICVQIVNDDGDLKNNIPYKYTYYGEEKKGN